MAMQLSRTERADLIKQLLASLDGPDDACSIDDVEKAWLAEVDQRIDKVNQGSATTESWDVVRSRIAAKLRTAS